MNGTTSSPLPPHGEPLRFYEGEAKASKIGLFSGKEKRRLNFENDPTGRFAVGIFKEKRTVEEEWNENRKWVPLQVGDRIYKVEIASIARRLGKSEKKVIADYKKKYHGQTKLDFDFGRRVINYNQDMDAIKSTLETIRKTDSNKNGIARNAFIKLKTKLRDPELSALCKEYSKQINDRTSRIPVNEDAEATKAREKDWDKATLKILENFVSDLPEEVITDERLETISQSFSNPIQYRNALILKNSPGDEHYRICLVNPDDDLNGKYAVRIEERTYPGRPQTDSTYVPYTEDEDGKVWVRLNIASLSKRLSIPPEEIKKAAEEDIDGKKLRKLIETNLPVKKETHNIVFGFKTKEKPFETNNIEEENVYESTETGLEPQPVTKEKSFETTNIEEENPFETNNIEEENVYESTQTGLESQPAPRKIDQLLSAISKNGFASVKEQVASLGIDEFKQFLQMKISQDRYVLHEDGVLDELLTRYNDSPLTESQQDELASLFHFGENDNNNTLSLLFTHCSQDKLYDLLERLDQTAVYNILNRTRRTQYSSVKVFGFMHPTPRVIKFLNTLNNDNCSILLESDWELFSKKFEEDQEIDLGAMTGLCIKMGDYKTLCNWMAQNNNIQYNSKTFEPIFKQLPLEGIAALLKHKKLKQKIEWEWAKPFVQEHYRSHDQSAGFSEDEKSLYFLNKSYIVQESPASVLRKKLTNNQFLSKDINAIRNEVLTDLKSLTYKGLMSILTYQVEQNFTSDGFLAQGKSFMQYTEVLDEILRRYSTSVIPSTDERGLRVMLDDDVSKDQLKKKKEVVELFCAKDQNGQTLYSLHNQNEQVQQLLEKLYEWQSEKVKKEAEPAMEGSGTIPQAQAWQEMCKNPDVDLALMCEMSSKVDDYEGLSSWMKSTHALVVSNTEDLKKILQKLPLRAFVAIFNALSDDIEKSIFMWKLAKERVLELYDSADSTHFAEYHGIKVFSFGSKKLPL